MGSTLLEQARLLHEDAELHKQAAVQTLAVDHKQAKDAIHADAKVAAHISAVVASTQRALQLYEDVDGLRKIELEELAGLRGEADVFRAFYDRLMAIRDYHKKFPNASAASADDASTLTVRSAFSGEENGGKFLDLHSLYSRYVNLPQFKKRNEQIDYLLFLAKFDKFDYVPRWKKLDVKSREYEQYLNDLYRYLTEFFHRTNPLVNVSRLLSIIDEDFELRWAEQKIPHWFAPEAPAPTSAQLRERKAKDTADKLAKQQARIKAEADAKKAAASGKPAAAAAAGDGDGDDMNDDAPSAAAVAAAAAAKDSKDTKSDTAAAATTENGAAAAAAATAATASSASAAATGVTVDENSPLFCKACKHMYAKQSVFDAHLPGKKHKKAAAKAAADAAQATSAAHEAAAQAILTQQKRLLLQKQIAAIEDKITIFADLLAPQLTETQKFIEKKQTSLPDEIKRDLEAEARLEEEAILSEDEKESEDGEKPLYNPLNLPLDYNGKPIPYWLYKLHGLNIEYKCELCGGYSYWGPRAFERHFKEWRHAYGLKCLGIPNLKEFMNVTKIEDAKLLWDKLSKETSGREFKPEEDEEFEDHEGNVYNKKTYEDLRKQGLI